MNSFNYTLSILTVLIFLFTNTCQRFEPEGFLNVDTGAISAIASSSAQSGGEVTDEGGSPVSARGVCWSRNSEPTKSNCDGQTSDGSGSGSFVSTLSELIPASTYYVRAYAMNSDGITYGDEVSFTTAPVTVPTVSTDPATSVGETFSVLNGTVTEDGGAEVTARGFYYGTSANPVATGIKIAQGNGDGNFSSNVSGLSSGTTYKYVAYATNSIGTSYGEERSFTTTPVNAPVVSTKAASSVGETFSILNGAVTEDGGAAVTERGFYYGTSDDPATTGTKITQGDGTGSFSSNISGLSSGLTYYFIAYATNSFGTAFGDIMVFTTTAIPDTPSVSTNPATSVDESSAILNGNVTDEGGAAVTDRGFYYGTSSNPAATGVKVTEGIGTGTYSFGVSGLTSGTTHYFVAYATNSAGTAFGAEVKFSTSSVVELPRVSTNEATSISETTALLNGNVTSDGGGDVTERGFYYGTSADPSETGSRIPRGDGTGSYSYNVSGLSPGTSYYFETFATNSAGTAYGDEKSFTTLDDSGETVSDIDGNIYQTVQIYDQVWMAENLKVTHYADGSAIPLKETTTEWDALSASDKAYCWYDNSSTNRDEYGGLYTWAAAMNGAGSSSANPSGIQGVCPSGWHLPSDDEWKTLEINLGMSSSEASGVEFRGTDEGGQLKETGSEHWNSPNSGATNSSGFTALAGGYRDIDGGFFDKLVYARFWSATEDSGNYTWIRFLLNERDEVYRNVYHKYNGFSVRCIQD